jgi:molybdate transport system ATP-binding protein
VPGIGIRLERCSLLLGRRRVLADVSIDVEPGERLLLLGANGAGKTQLIKLLAGLRWPSPTGAGERHYRDARGRPLHLIEAREHIAYVGAESQDRYARRGWNHTLAQVVATGLFGTDIPLDVPGELGRARVERLLARFGLSAAAGTRMLEASYGQRRLALVARALAGRPRLLLLDEVFNGLDERHRRRLVAALGSLLRTRTTIVASAHRAEDVPPGMRRAALVVAGRVRPLAPPVAIARLAPLPATPRAPRRSARRRPHPGEPRIELRNVTVYREDRLVLRGLDWSLRDGEHWAVTGPNGSGKSTFLELLYGARPVALGGEVLRRGHPRGTPLEEIRRSTAIVSPGLQSTCDPSCTLEELVVSGLRDSIGLDDPPDSCERGRAREALASLGLLSLAPRRPREVSYGELRLALLARAFVKRPRLLLLDEPFTGLDPARRRRLRAALSRLARGGTQLVIAVHQRGDLPPEVNRRLHLRRGRGRELPLR